MKRSILCLAFIFLLSSCSSAENLKEDFTNWRSELDILEFTADIIMSAGDTAQQFTVSYTEQEDGAQLEIISPERIKGLTASMSAGDTELKFDGLVLDITLPSGFSPAKALPMLADTIRNGYIDQCYKEKQNGEKLIALQFAPNDDMVLHLWLNSQKVPIVAEFEQNGMAVIKINITDWK